MTRPLLMTTALAAGLLAILLVELRPDTASPPEAAPAPRTQAASAPVPAPATPPDLLQPVLARPLFSATRRPVTADAPADSPSTEAALPRVTAILIDGPRRSVIFAPAGGKPVVVAEGGRIGAFTVQRIEPQGATVLGPQGLRTVRTSFDPSLPPPPALLGLQGAMPPMPPPPFTVGSGLPLSPGAAR